MKKKSKEQFCLVGSFYEETGFIGKWLPRFRLGTKVEDPQIKRMWIILAKITPTQLNGVERSSMLKH